MAQDAPEKVAESEDAPIATWEDDHQPVRYSYLPWSRNPPDTPQAVSIIGFLLGSLCLFGLQQAWSLPFAWHNNEPTGLWRALWSPQLGAYFAALSIFHMLEYLTTAIYNPSKVHVGSYLLHNGMHYHIAHFAGMLEFVLEEAYIPAPYRAFKHKPAIVLAGLALVIAAQYLRSLAMITAASNFSHDVQFVKADKHVLVTSGVYQFSRHPSYTGFFYWAIGTQLLCANPVCVVAFAAIVWRFFSQRIFWEERALVSFFGRDYVEYRKRVGTRIPFIP